MAAPDAMARFPGVMVADRPLEPVTDRPIVSLKWNSGLAVIVEVAGVPVAALSVEGEAESEKSGWTTRIIPYI